jgi:hypothetical protein
MKRSVLRLAALTSPLLLAAPAFAQQHYACAPRSEITAKLARDFKEVQQGVGVVNDKAVIEIFVSGKGSWTIIATGVDGNSCLLSSGENWEGNGFVKGLDASFAAPLVH